MLDFDGLRLFVDLDFAFELVDEGVDKDLVDSEPFAGDYFEYFVKEVD